MARPAAPLTPLTPDQRAMVEQNLGLVGHTLALYYPKLTRDPDAFNDGVIGLARATRDWDPGRGTFSTYATNWIRSEIGNGIGRLLGINARHAHRTGRDYEAPLSIDAERVGDTGPIEEFLVGDDDPVSDSLFTLAAAALRRLALDPLDQALADRILAGALGIEAEPMGVVAQRHGYSRSAAHLRHRRLLDLLRDQLEPVA